ncbi:MAG: leucine--tRNA ligase, partial [Candidatus Ranarchaeia archaeon]
KQDFRSLGFGIDWRRSFTTGDPEYNAFVSWQFWRLKDKGYIKQGCYPVIYCPHDRNAVGEDDLLTGENAKVVEFTGIKFPCKDGFFVASTLRPETVYGVTNLWVRPDGDYVKANVDNEVWYVSKVALSKLELQAHKVELLESFKGKDLIGIKCRLPIKKIKRELLVLPADFVDPKAATGVVYSVPAHAPYDYQGLVDLKRNSEKAQKYGLSNEQLDSIQPIAIIKIEGYGEFPAKDICEKMGVASQLEADKLEKATEIIYRDEFYRGVMLPNTGQFSGRLVREVKEDVLKFLQDIGRATPIYELDQREVICRCNTPVTVAVLDNQWFLNYGHPKWKAAAKKLLANMIIKPEKYRTYFEATFDWLHERPCARRRGIGTHLPFDETGDWIIESLSDSTIYMAFYTIIHLIRKHKLTKEQLTPSFFDYVFLGRGDDDKIAKKNRIPLSVLNEMRNEFKYWYPNDLRHTAISHISNHLSFFIFHHAAIFPPKYQPKAITLNEHLIREGKKMSKSKGNVIPLADIPKHYSADLARLFYISAAELDGVVDWRTNQLKGVQTKLNQIWATVETILDFPYANLASIEDDLSYQSRWMLSRIDSAVLKATTNLNDYAFRSYILLTAFALVNDIRRYIELSEHLEKSERGAVLWYTLDKWIRLLCPAIPHVAEEAWSKMQHNWEERDFVSIAKWPEPTAKYIDVQIERAQEIVNNTVDDVKEVLKLISHSETARPTHIRIYTASKWKYIAFLNIHEKRIRFTVPDIMTEVSKVPELVDRKKELAQLAKRLVKMSKLPVFTTPEKEHQALEEAIDLFKNEVNLTAEIITEEQANFENDSMNKAQLALPGKPAFYLYTPGQSEHIRAVHENES